MGHDRDSARMSNLSLSLEVAETCNHEGSGNHFLGHVTASLPQQGDQVGFWGMEFSENSFARASANVGSPKIGASITKRCLGLLDGKLLESGLQGEH
jgi:hypothetical protein